ncbi:hypothetical protein [Roseiarcus fermentans]|uniref:hypothetical protein n=1 Tax=Roseiarcus fermentans TaxID=1473586 RepID=UPI000DE8CD09|nr:hypothetical protein [Roseiarcus fermentans]
MPDSLFRAPAWLLGLVSALCLSGCAVQGAPSFVVAGAFFPAWMACAAIGFAAAAGARGIFVATGLAGVLPLQFFVCGAIGVLAALGCSLVWFGR